MPLTVEIEFLVLVGNIKKLVNVNDVSERSYELIMLKGSVEFGDSDPIILVLFTHGGHVRNAIYHEVGSTQCLIVTVPKGDGSRNGLVVPVAESNNSLIVVKSREVEGSTVPGERVVESVCEGLNVVFA